MHRSTHVIGAVSILATLVLVVFLVTLIVLPKDQRERLLGLSHPCVYRDDGALPDQGCTPGAVNHVVTQATIHKTICVSGWTATVRPPSSVTAPEKLAAMRRYGYVFGTSPRGYEFDHLIPLELGGAPNDTRNLWPEPHTVAGSKGSFTKDGVENALRRAVCAGRVKLAVARREIRTDWTKATIP